MTKGGKEVRYTLKKDRTKKADDGRSFVFE